MLPANQSRAAAPCPPLGPPSGPPSGPPWGLPLEALAAERLLLLESATSVRRMLDDAFAARGLRLVPWKQAMHSGTLIGMAQAGLGIALLPSTAAELRMAPELVQRPLRPDLVREVMVVRRAGRSLSPAADALVRALRDGAPALG